jgi:DNA-binding LytR/AlgR family response regulator
MKLSCIIVDDDRFSSTLLYKMCKNHESLNVKGVFENPEDALVFLENEYVDIIWLDVEMPQLSGFDLLKNIISEPYIIITSSKVEYAFEAFEHKVSDYLKKPILVLKFKETVEKALNYFQSHAKAEIQNKNESIFVKIEGKYIKLNFTEILYLENIGDYVKIYTESKTHLVLATMKYLEGKLPLPFVRVHRSFIVNINKIVDIEESTLVIANKVIPISRLNKVALLKNLNMI